MDSAPPPRCLAHTADGLFLYHLISILGVFISNFDFSLFAFFQKIGQPFSYHHCSDIGVCPDSVWHYGGVTDIEIVDSKYSTIFIYDRKFIRRLAHGTGACQMISRCCCGAEPFVKFVFIAEYVFFRARSNIDYVV